MVIIILIISLIVRRVSRVGCGQVCSSTLLLLGHWNELLFGTLPCYRGALEWTSIWYVTLLQGGIGMNFYLVRYLATGGHWNELLFGTLPCYSSPPQWCSIWGIGMNFYLVHYLATGGHWNELLFGTLPCYRGALEWTSIWYVTLLQLPTTVVQYLGHWNELLFGMSPCYSSPPQWCSIWGIGMNFYLVRYLATAPHHSGAVSGALEWTSIWYVALLQLPTTVVQYLGHWNELLFGTLPCYSSPPQWCSIWDSLSCTYRTIHILWTLWYIIPCWYGLDCLIGAFKHVSSLVFCGQWCGDRLLCVCSLFSEALCT